MQKNEEYIVECTSYTSEGLGVVRIDDFVFFVPNLIRGEVAKVGITAMKKSYGYARVIEIIKPSPNRVEAKCPIHKMCGGCDLQIMNRDEQNYLKSQKVRDAFLANAKMEVDLEPIIYSDKDYEYRNKVQVPVQYNDGKTCMGFYKRRSNDIIEFDYCHIQSPLSNEITKTIKHLISKLNITKNIRHVLIKHAHRNNEVLVCLVVREYPFEGSELLKDELIKKYPEIKSLSVIVNRRSDNVILDGKEILLAGMPYIEEELLGKKFLIHAKSFFQVNPYSTELLYSKAIEYAGLTGKEVVVDMYCGTGTIGLLASERAKKVYGIEIVSDAIKDAKENAKLNNVKNIDFYNMDAKEGASALLRSNIKVDVIIVDPPRKGLTKDTIDAMIKINPERIVYVSCDPGTLARDINILKEYYNIDLVQPVDMFPQTPHVETDVLMSRDG